MRPHLAGHRHPDGAEERCQVEAELSRGACLRGHPSAGHTLAVVLHCGEDRHVGLPARVLAVQRSLAVPVRDDPVGHPALQCLDGDFQQVPRHGPLHVDRTGVHMWSVHAGVPGVIAGGQLDRVGEHLLGRDAVTGEVAGRVPSLVLQDAFMGERVDDDLLPGPDVQHRSVGGAGQPAPEDVLCRGREVPRPFGQVLTGLQDRFGTGLPAGSRAGRQVRWQAHGSLSSSRSSLPDQVLQQNDTPGTDVSGAAGAADPLCQRPRGFTDVAGSAAAESPRLDRFRAGAACGFPAAGSRAWRRRAVRRW